MAEDDDRLFLNVPYTEKDAAKELGARWDAKERKWFVPGDVEAAAFAKWNPYNEGDRPQDTHGLRIGLGKHSGELWTRIPVGYLKYLMRQGGSAAATAKAEFERRGTEEPGVEVSIHAVDRAYSESALGVRPLSTAP